MEMIDVLKRLAELDAANPQVVNRMVPNGIDQKTKTVTESETPVAECGPMGMMGSSAPNTPASINITAASGEELSHMLKDIMSLAGVGGHQHDAEPSMGVDVISTEPMEPAVPSSGGDIMRGMLDRLNPDDDDQEDDEDEDEMEAEAMDNTPEDPTRLNPYPKNSVGTPGTQDPAGDPGVGDRMDGNRPKAFPTFESLMAEYKKFIAENQDVEETHWARYTDNPHLGGSRIRPGQDPNQYKLVDVNTGKKFSKGGEIVVFNTRDHALAVAKKLKFGDWEPMPILSK